MLGIDAPDLPHRSDPEQCWAARPRSELAQVAPVGATVVLLKNRTQDDRDRHGRLLRYLEVDGRDAGAALLEAGSARPFWPAGPGSRSTDYQAAASVAERHHRGLWTACPMKEDR